MTLPDTDFKYIDALAKEVERPCSQAQFLANLDIAPLGFCEILSTYATGPCGCQYPDGTAIVPQLPAAEWPECNICGPGGQIGDGNAVVPLVNHIELRTLFPCQELQRLANTPNVFPVSFCPSIVEQSLATCRCFTPDDGGLISDKTVVPTSAPVALSPTAGGSAPSQPSAGNNGGGSPTDGSNGSSNNGPTSSNNGGSSDAALSSKSVGSFMCALVVVMSMMML